MDGCYTTADVVRISGFSARQLDYWGKQGLVVASIEPSQGSGHRKLYSIEDLIQLRFIRQLKTFGWSTQKIRSALVVLSDVMDDPQPLKRALLVHGKNTVLALCKTKEGERILFDTLSTGRQQAMLIVIETLIEETKEVTKERQIEHSGYKPKA